MCMFSLRQIKKWLKNPFSWMLFMLWLSECYSQLWEDRIIDFLILKDNNGIEKEYKWLYIDIWGNDPIRNSNSYFFYKKWWRWINIEPNKNLIKKFIKKRPEDINLQIAAWKENWNLTFYSFEVDQVSTCDTKAVKRYEDAWHKVIDTYTVPVLTLEKIFDTYAKDRKIDILSVDVEWLDMAVLESNNWEKYKPIYIIVETVENWKNWWIKQSNIFDPYMKSKWYWIVWETWANTIYKLL